MSTPWLGSLPLSPQEGVKTYDVSQHVPDTATEILIYAFATVGGSLGKETRAVYEFYTEDADNNHYSQLLNMAFINNDFVLNSANLWFPIYNQRELNIHLPAEWTIETQESSALQAFRTQRAKGGPNLSEALKAYISGEEKIFADIFLLGYRTSETHQSACLHEEKTQA